MHAIVIPLPSLLPPDSFSGRTVVVLDVLRATTTIACALAAGAAEVRVFVDLGSARRASRDFAGPRLLAGERECHKPEGFDLGNSPLEMTRQSVAGRTVFMSTTNGTRAIQVAFDHKTLLKAQPASACLAGALVNAAVTAQAVRAMDRDVLLLCAGSDGEIAEEDLVGAGAILSALEKAGAHVQCSDDAGAVEWCERFVKDPWRVLKQTRGGQKLLGAGMAADVVACARLDSVEVACHIDDRLRIRGVTPEQV